MTSQQDDAAKHSDSQDVFACLIEDHRTVASLMEAIQGAIDDGEPREEGGGDDHRDQFSDLALLLEAHSKAEDRIVYTALAERSEKLSDMIREAREEHALVDQVLGELKALEESDPTWAAKFKVLKDLVEHHVDEEESDMIENGRKELEPERARELAADFLAAKEKIKGELTRADRTVRRAAAEHHAEVEADQAGEVEAEPQGLGTMSKKQLIERARAVKVSGYSHMTKAQLVSALEIKYQQQAERDAHDIAAK